MQSRLQSLFESLLNVFTGMIIAWSTMQFVLAPLLDIGITPTDNVIVTLVFTTLSIIRNYIWRRIFVKFAKKRIEDRVKKVREFTK